MNIVIETSKKLYAEPNTGLGGISKVYDDYIVADIGSWFKTTRKLRNSEQKLLCALFDGKIKFLPDENSTFSDHGVLRVVRDAFLLEVSNTIKKLPAVGFIGTTARELAYFSEQTKIKDIWGVVGNFNAQDKVRLSQNLRWAKSHKVSSKLKDPEISRAYLNFSEGRDNKYFYNPGKDTPLADALVLIDSIYDITPEQLFEYFRKSQATVAYATLIFAPELAHLNESIQPQLDITWFTDRHYAYMRHIRGKSLGYVHLLKNILRWNFNSYFQFENKALIVENVSQYSTYSLVTITCIDACVWHGIRTLPVSSFYKPIIDVKAFVRHHREHIYFVDGFKLIKIIDYISRLTIEKTEPSTILTYVSAMRHRLIVGNHEIEGEFVIDEKTLKMAIRFAIFYAILKKTDVYNTVGMAVKTAKKDNGKYKHILFQRFQEIWDWMRGVDRRILINKLDQVMYSTPEYIIEKVGVDDWNKLNIPAHVQDQEPQGYVFSVATTPEMIEDEKHEQLWQLSKRLIKQAERAKKIQKVETPQVTSVEVKVDDWKQQILLKFNAVYEQYVHELSEQFLYCDKIYNLPCKANRGLAKAKELKEAFFHDRRSVFEIGNFPGFSTLYFRGQGMQTIAVSPTEMTNSPNPGSWKQKAKVQLYGKFEDQDLEFIDGLVSNPVWYSDASLESGRSVGNKQLHLEIVNAWIESSSDLLVIKVFELEPFMKYITKYSFTVCKPKYSKQNEELYLVLSKIDYNKDALIEDIEVEIKELQVRINAIGCEHYYTELTKVTGATKPEIFKTMPLKSHTGKPDITQVWLKSFNVDPNEFILDIGGGACDKLDGFVNYCNVDPLVGTKLEDIGFKKVNVVIVSHVLHHLDKATRELAFQICENANMVFYRDHDVTDVCRKWSLYRMHKFYGEECKDYFDFQYVLDRFERAQLFPTLVVNGNFWTKKTVFTKTGGSVQFALPQDQCAALMRNSISHYFTKAIGSSYNNYQEMHKKISDSLQQIRNLPDYSKINVTLMCRVAGGGKTTLILDSVKPGAGHYYVCNTGELLAKFRDDFDRKYRVMEKIPAKTFEAMLLENPRNVKAIHVDEAFTFPMTYIIALFTLFPRSIIKLYGDPMQTACLDKDNYIPAGLQLQNFVQYFNSVNRSNITRRFGDNLCKYLREYESYDIVSAVQKTFKLNFYKFGKEPDGYNITFSDESKKMLLDSGKGGVTVRASQGQDHDVVNLYLSQFDHFAIGNPSLRRVALTRARDCLNIIELDDYNMTQKMFPHIHKIQTFAEITTQMIPVIPNHHKVVTDSIVVSKKPAVTTFDPIALINTFANRLFDNLQESVTVSTDASAKGFTINSMNYYIKSDKPSERLTTTNFGKQFYVSSKHQTLMTAVDRLAKSAMNGNIALTVDKLASNRLFVENVSQVFLKDKIRVNADKILTIFHKHIQEITQKKLGFSANLGTLEENSWAAFEFVKQQVKPLKELDRVASNKLGQSIKAWSNEANTALGALFRTLKSILIENLNERFIYANNCSEPELAKKIADLGPFDGTKDLDAEFMDGCHNAVTVDAEKDFWLVIMGGNISSAVNYYAHMRKGLQVISDVAKYSKGAELDSGSVATIDANIFLAMFTCMKLFDMKKCLGGPFKGDDVSLLWNKPIPKLDISRLKGFTNMKLKEEENDHVYFCNTFYDAGYFFYDLRILIKKILQREYVKYNEKLDRNVFVEYQRSVKTLLTPYLEHKEVRDLFAAYTRQSIAMVEIQVDLLNAFTELTWNQLKKELNKQIIFQV